MKGANILVIVTALCLSSAEETCHVVREYQGSWFTRDNGVYTSIKLDGDQFGDLKCIDSRDGLNRGFLTTMLVKDVELGCLHCLDVKPWGENYLGFIKDEYCAGNHSSINMCQSKQYSGDYQDLYREIPSEYQGAWYSYENEVTTMTGFRFGDFDYIEYSNVSNEEGVNTTFLMKFREGYGDSQCRYCVDFLLKNENILQYRKSDCIPLAFATLDLCLHDITYSDAEPPTTLFRKEFTPVNCSSTLNGNYQFSYEEADWGYGGGPCNSSNSTIEACHEYYAENDRNNEVFMINYAKCPDVQASRKQTIRYLCLGTWSSMVHTTRYTFAAVVDPSEMNIKDGFKCLMTLEDQDSGVHGIRWVMSQFPRCDRLLSVYNAPVRLVLKEKYDCEERIAITENSFP